MAKTKWGLTQDEITGILGGHRRVRQALLILQHVAGCHAGATSQECSDALGIAHQSSSPRFHELIRAGCLEATGKKRATGHGGQARVHRVAPGADFHSFLKMPVRARSRSKSALSPEEQQILAAGLTFVRSWRRTPPEARQVLATGFLTRMVQISAAGERDRSH